MTDWLEQVGQAVGHLTCDLCDYRTDCLACLDDHRLSEHGDGLTYRERAEYLIEEEA